VRRRVLFVDDDPSVTDAMRRSLRDEPYQVATAGSGDEALAVLRKGPVDVIVSDEMMPGMSGSDLLALVRRDYPGTARMILTGQATLDAAIRAINEGEVYRFFTKPARTIDLALAIRQALALKVATEPPSHPAREGPRTQAPVARSAPPTDRAARRRKRFEFVLGGETAAPAAQKLRGSTSAPPAGVPNQEYVLIADGDPRVRLAYKAKLEELGIAVSEAKDGIDAWAQFQYRSVLCLIMEMKLSGYHGLDLLRRMTERKLDVPVVVVTAHGELANEFAVATYPRLTFLTKPASPGQVAYAVQAHLSRDRSARSAARPAAAPGTPGSHVAREPGDRMRLR
jgi:DNA-binding NtrC family response regulator